MVNLIVMVSTGRQIGRRTKGNQRDRKIIRYYSFTADLEKSDHLCRDKSLLTDGREHLQALGKKPTSRSQA